MKALERHRPQVETHGKANGIPPSGSHTSQMGEDLKETHTLYQARTKDGDDIVAHLAKMHP